jgi:spermidine synthase
MWDLDTFLRKRGDLQLSPIHQIGELSVFQFQRYRWLQSVGGSFQSLMDLEDPSRPLLPSTQTLLAALIFNPTPQRILNLGLGGGTHERFINTHLPAAICTSVESDTNVLTVARQYFHLPKGWPVVVENAAGLIRHSNQNYDLIFCDIFEGWRHPDCLYDEDFYRHCHRSLSPRGAMAINLVPGSEKDMLKVLQAVRSAFSHTILTDIPSNQNIVVYALRQPPPPDQELERRSLAVHSLGLNLELLLQRMVRLPST